MSKVKVYELRRTKEVERMERRINRKLKLHKLDSMIRLFQTPDGRIGYSAQIIPSLAGRKTLDLVHQLVCKEIGYQKGRPLGKATHQVKCRVPEDVYQRLVRKAQNRHVKPTTLASELIAHSVAS